MKMRSEKEVDDLVSTARDLCEALAAYRSARDECRLSSEVDGMTQNTLSVLEQRLELLKNNAALDRERAKKRTHAILLSNFIKKRAQ